MHYYCRRSLVTISSDAAIGDHESFLTVSRPHETPLFLAAQLSRESICKVQLLKDSLSGKLENIQTSVSARAWTLQEHLLSPRTLSYTPKQIVRQCQRQTRYR
jgi:hypothetical protein